MPGPLRLTRRRDKPTPPGLALTGADTLKLHVSSAVGRRGVDQAYSLVVVMHPAGLVKTLGVRLVLDRTARRGTRWYEVGPPRTQADCASGEDGRGFATFLSA